MPNIEITTKPTGRSPENKYFFGEKQTGGGYCRVNQKGSSLHAVCFEFVNFTQLPSYKQE